MKAAISLILPALTGLLLSGCAAVEGIFKVGMGFGIVITIAIVVLVIYLTSKVRKK